MAAADRVGALNWGYAVASSGQPPQSRTPPAAGKGGLGQGEPTISVELLERFLRAPPAKRAAIERILGVKAETLKAETLKAETLNGETESVSEEVARSAFALLQKLELDAPLKPPSVLTVFRLYCVDGLSAERVARKCRCAKSTVMSRLRFIERVTKTPPLEFRTVSGHLQAVDDDLRSSGAREIYRRGLAGGNQDG